MNRITMMEGEGGVYHCIGRIVGGGMILGEQEKEHFRKLMWRLAEFSGVQLITYCLMTNHVHLLVRIDSQAEMTDEEIHRRMIRYYGRREPWVQLAELSFRSEGKLPSRIRERLLARMGNVSAFMQTLKRRFSLWYNRRKKRFGTLWAEKFKSVLVQDSAEAVQTVAMYIDLNPVRAGLVKDPKDYRFCGHAEAAAGSKLARRGIVELYGGLPWRKAGDEYRCMMMMHAGEERAGKAPPNREEILKVLRKGGRLEVGDLLRLRLRYLSDGLVLGSKEFVEAIYARNREKFGRRRQSGARPLRALGGGLSGLATVRDLRVGVVG